MGMDIKGIKCPILLYTGCVRGGSFKFEGRQLVKYFSVIVLHCDTDIWQKAQFRCMFFLSITIGLSKMRQLIDKT